MSPWRERLSPGREWLSPWREEYFPKRKCLSPRREKFSPWRRPYFPWREKFSPWREWLSPWRERFIPWRKEYFPERKKISPWWERLSPVWVKMWLDLINSTFQMYFPNKLRKHFAFTAPASTAFSTSKSLYFNKLSTSGKGTLSLPLTRDRLINALITPLPTSWEFPLGKGKHFKMAITNSYYSNKSLPLAKGEI